MYSAHNIDDNKVLQNNFMKTALDEATIGITNGDGGPFGAIIVLDGGIVGRGHNRVVCSNDPTAHGEVEAIRDACRNLKRFDLSNTVLYTTCYPCPMCMGAILWARIEKVFYCATSSDAEKLGFDDSNFYSFINDRSKMEAMLLSCDDMKSECLSLFEKYKGTIY
jgi:tRNA(Arg) A34 adenosine deaminase TadA